MKNKKKDSFMFFLKIAPVFALNKVCYEALYSFVFWVSSFFILNSVFYLLNKKINLLRFFKEIYILITAILIFVFYILFSLFIPFDKYQNSNLCFYFAIPLFLIFLEEKNFTQMTKYKDVMKVFLKFVLHTFLYLISLSILEIITYGRITVFYFLNADAVKLFDYGYKNVVLESAPILFLVLVYLTSFFIYLKNPKTKENYDS